MGKVKSAIITALLVAAIIALALFATISFNVSNGVKRYNSFISSIPLGSELTGDASVILYPEGVITEAEYERAVENDEKKEEYQGKYEHVEEGLYVDKDKLGEEFVASIKADAEIISDRLSQKGYTSYSVAVVDTYGIHITVPTGFTYTAYKGTNKDARTEALSAITHAVSYLALEGGLDLRDGTSYESSKSLVRLDDDLRCFIKNAKLFRSGGVYAVRINLTNEGLEEFNTLLGNASDNGVSTAYLYAGKTNLQLSFTTSTVLEEKSLYFQADENYSQDYAILLNSIVRGNMLENRYNENNTATLVATTPVYGENAALFLAILVLVVILVAAILPIIKYKRLGLVNTLMVCSYTVAITTAILLTGVQLTIGGVFTALLGLVLLCFSNFFTFEAVRRETSLGRTISASVKLGYKKSMFGVLDVHVILVIAAILMTLIGVGELAACGLIFFIGSIASFVLYWFTRFMWYVLSSPARNKFAFCGFVREVEEDE